MEDYTVPPAIRTCHLPDPSYINALVPSLLYFFQLLYAMISSLGYLYIIWFLLKAQNSKTVLSHDYLKIYVMDGIISLIVVILDFMLTRPLIYLNGLCHLFFKWFPEPTYLLTPYLTLFNYFQFAKLISTFLLSANRFTCVAYPVAHKVIWQHTNYIISLAMLSPTAVTWHLAISPTVFDAYSGEGLLGYVRQVEWPWVRTRIFKLVLGTVVLLFIVYSNLRIHLITRKFKDKFKGLERTLTMSTLVTSVVFVIFILIQSFLLIFSVSFLVEHLWLGSILKKIEFCCNDFYILSSPIVLFIMNKQLRSSIRKFCPATPQNTVKPEEKPLSKVDSKLVPATIAIVNHTYQAAKNSNGTPVICTPHLASE